MIPVESDDNERANALRRYGILDTEPEQAFDDLTALAAQICDMPVSLISFLDVERLWVKSAYGLDVSHTPPEIALCANAILEPDGLLYVRDVASDARFFDSPFIRDERALRAYAAAALVSPDGYPLGVICVADAHPRELNDEQLDALKRLGRQVVSQLELRDTARRLTDDIARRKQAERELAASERLYRELVENAPGLIGSHTLDGTLRSVNDATVQLLGYARSQLVGHNLREFVPAQHWDAYDDYLKAFTAARHSNGLLTLIHREGRPVILAYQNFRFDSDAGSYVVCHGIDVSERERAAAMNRRFAVLLEASSDFVGVADVSGRPLYLNRAGRRMCGIGPDEDVRHAGIDELLGADGQAVFAERVKVAVEQGTWAGETAIVDREGTRTPVSELIVVPRDDKGRPEFIATIARDISDRKRNEEAIRRSERRIRHVVENVREVLFETDAEGRWTFLNPAWTEITGFALDESLGQTFSAFVHPDDVERNRELFEPLMQRKKSSCRHEIRCRTKDGRFRWLEVHARLVLGPGERVDGTSGTLRDITEQRALSEQIVKAREEALAASRLKSDFVANMSHEIRTPINGVIGLTTLLLDTTLSAEQRDYAQGVRQSAEALLAIINDVLDLSKIEAGKLTIEPIPFAPRVVVSQALDPVNVKADRKRLALDVRIDSAVPAHLVGDPLRIRQVLLNLADNAVKFTERGAVVLTVKPDGRPDVYRFSVADSGIGIPEEKLDAVFEKFVQADGSTTRQYGGSGLGLTICRQLVELMGGQIGVESRVGAGSTFWFTLPLPLAQGLDAPASSAAAMAAPAEPAIRRHVLIAEDNHINQKVARRYLEKLGCQVDVVENGELAVNAVRRRAYDAVFMDCQMPVMDGYEATRRIRAFASAGDLPIIAMTAHAMLGDRERCLEAGMTDYVSKPLQPDALRAAVDRLSNRQGPAASQEGPPPFDMSAVLTWFDGDVETIRELISLLVDDLPRYVASLGADLHATNYEAAARMAHTIKGAVGNVAETRVSGLAAAIEAALLEGDHDRARQLGGEIGSASSTLIEALVAWSASLPAVPEAATSGGVS